MQASLSVIDVSLNVNVIISRTAMSANINPPQGRKRSANRSESKFISELSNSPILALLCVPPLPTKREHHLN